MITLKGSSSTRCSGESALGGERAKAQACQEYLENVVRPRRLFHGRDRVVAGLEDLYARRLRLPEARGRIESLRFLLDDPDTVLIEMAHDGQLPHLGIARLVLKARQLAELVPKGLALYLVGDHYSAEMRPENLYLGLPLRGVDADQVKNPLTVPTGRRFRHVPFRWLPPPKVSSLEELQNRAEDWLLNNVTHADRKSRFPELREALRSQFEVLFESASQTRSFGDWLMRVQILTFDAMFGAPPSRLAVLPMSGIVEWMPDVLRSLSEKESTITAAKAAVSEAQRSRDEVPYASGDTTMSSFWVHCSTCFRRYRARWEGDVCMARCLACRKEVQARWAVDLDRIMPDIVAYELGLFRMGVAGWVVGSKAPYHPVIEQAHRSLYGYEMPPKFFLTSVPTFTGLGEPGAGHTRARLLRALVEIRPSRLREALEAPWDFGPEIRSPFL